MSESIKSKAAHARVTAIIPTYNYAHFVGDAIQSVLGQTFPDWELIVVDDGSTDNTADVVASFQDSRIRYIYQDNRGNAAARNTALKLARGEYIAFLDADDLWLPQKLERQVEALDKLAPTTGIIYTDLYIHQEGEETPAHRLLENRDPPRGNMFRQLVRREWKLMSPLIPTSTVLARQEVFDRVGPFDEGLLGHVDWEMWVRIAAVYDIDVVPEPLAVYRHHGQNIHKDVPLMFESGRKSLRKVLENYSLRPDDRRALLRSLARQYYGYALDQLAKGRRRNGVWALCNSLRLQPTFRRYYPNALLLLISPSLYGLLRAAWRRLTRREAEDRVTKQGRSPTAVGKE